MGGERGLLSLSQVPKAAQSTAGPSSTSPGESGKTFPARTHTDPSNLGELAVLRQEKALLIPGEEEALLRLLLWQSRMQKVPKGKPYPTFSTHPLKKPILSSWTGALWAVVWTACVDSGNPSEQCLLLLTQAMQGLPFWNTKQGRQPSVFIYCYTTSPKYMAAPCF